MRIGTGEIIVLMVIVICVFLLCREITCWYFKINKRIELQEKTNTLLESIAASLEKKDN